MSLFLVEEIDVVNEDEIGKYNESDLAPSFISFDGALCYLTAHWLQCNIPQGIMSTVQHTVKDRETVPLSRG